MFTLLCLLIAYLPFQIALNPTSGVDLASGRVFILLAFLLWFFWGLKNRKLRIANNLITYFLIAFLFFAGLSVFWADAPDRALRKLAVFLSILPLYFIIVGLVDSREKIERVFQCIIYPAVLLALIGIGQFFSQFFIGIEPIMRFWSEKIAFVFWGRSFGAEVISNPSWLANVGGATYLRAFSLFPDPHMFSFYLGLVIPLAVAQFSIFNFQFTIKSKSQKYESHSELAKNPEIAALGVPSSQRQITNGILHWPFRMTTVGILTVLILAQILTFSRGGYVGFGLFLLFIFWRNYSSHPERSEGSRRTSIKTIILIFFLFLILIFTNNPAKQRFMSIFNSRDGSNMGRMEIWKQSLAVSEDHFWTGVGIGNYSFYVEPRYGYRVPIYAHNTYLDILSEMGIFALLAWVGMILYVILNRAKRKEESRESIKQRDPAHSLRMTSLALAGSLLWFSGHAFFDTPIYSPTILPFLMIILGLISCLSYYHLE